jgi:hypothetical protein
MTENFTRLPVGAAVSSSRRIIRCPRCGRNGALEVRIPGAHQCIHVERSALRDGVVVESTDSCELPFPRD